MSQFKKFNASENRNWNTWETYEAGTLTWDPDRGLRIHDGNNGGGNPVGVSSYFDLTDKPTGSTAVHDLIGGSSSADNGKFLKQYAVGNSTWAYPSFLDYQGLQLSVLSDGSISLPNGSTIDNQKAIDHISGGANIQISDLTYASQGNPSGAVITSDSYTNDGWQYIMFDNADVYNAVTGMTGTNNGYFSVTWAAGSSQRTGYVAIQFLGGNQLQICPVLNDTDGNNTPVSGTWKFPLNIRGSVVYNGNVTLTVGSDLGNKTYVFGDNGYISLPAGGSISDYDAGLGSTSIGSSLTGTGYSQIYWDGAPGTGNPFNGSDLFSWMYVDDQGITLGYVNVEQQRDYEWKFNTDGNLTLPENGDIKDSNGNSAFVSLATLKTIVASSTNFADFQNRIANM